MLTASCKQAVNNFPNFEGDSVRTILEGTLDIPLAAEVIAEAFTTMVYEQYGQLEGVAEVATRAAAILHKTVVNQVSLGRQYEVHLVLDKGGDYFFAVKAWCFLGTRPRCSSWNGPGYYLLEVGDSWGGGPFLMALELGGVC